MGCWCGHLGRLPWLASPVSAAPGLVPHPLPPHAPVLRHGHVGEHRVLEDGRHRYRVALGAGARGHAKEAILGIDGSELPGLVRSEPGDVITDHGDLEPGQLRAHHSQVGLPARRGEGGCDVFFVTLEMEKYDVVFAI